MMARQIVAQKSVIHGQIVISVFVLFIRKMVAFLMLGMSVSNKRLEIGSFLSIVTITFFRTCVKDY